MSNKTIFKNDGLLYAQYISIKYETLWKLENVVVTPFIFLDETINYESIFKIQLKLMLYVIENPSVTLENICNLFQFYNFGSIERLLLDLVNRHLLIKKRTLFCGTIFVFTLGRFLTRKMEQRSFFLSNK